MKPEYDFSSGVRGKFFKQDSELRLPVYLDSDVQRYLAERAARRQVQDQLAGLEQMTWKSFEFGMGNLVSASAERPL